MNRKERAVRLHEKLSTAIGTAVLALYEAGGALSKIHKDKLWKELGYRSYNDYTSKVLGRECSTTMRWIRIHDVYSKVKFDKELLARAGIKRAYFMSFEVKRTNANKLLKWSIDRRVEEADDRTAHLRGSSGPKRSGRNSLFAVYMTQEQAARVELVIAAFMSKGARNRAEALMLALDDIKAELKEAA